MTDQTLKVGLIGPGSISRLHIDGLRRNPSGELIAVAASNSEKAKKIGQSLGVPYVYSDYHRLLENDLVGVVHIATRNQTHAEIAMSAIKAGKHVICEKPLGNGSDETSTLVNEASASGLVHAVCYNLRFYPLIHHIRAMIANGEIGHVHTIHGSYLQDWLCLDSSYNWRLDPQESGNLSTVADIGTHWMDLVQFVTGLTVTSVIANLNTVIPLRKKTDPTGSELSVRITNEDSAAILFGFEGGTKGSLLVSQVAPGHKNILSLEINGTKASVGWNSERPNELWIGYREQPNQIIISEASLLSAEAKAVSGPGHTKGILDTWHQFLNSVYTEIQLHRSFNPNNVSFATFFDGHSDIKILEAIVTSSKTKSWEGVVK